MFRVIIATGVVLTAGVVSAATIHVPADQPTIQAGIDAAVDGDTVLVAPGVYVQSITFNGKRIVVTSSSGRSLTTIQSSSVTLPNVTIASGEPKGTELSGFTISGSQQGAVYCRNSSPKIAYNEITGNIGGGASESGGIDMENCHNAVIYGNIFHNNKSVTYGGAVHMRTCNNDTIAYNLSYGNNAYAEFRGVTCTGVFYNNTVSVTMSSGLELRIGGQYQARNNIIFFSNTANAALWSSREEGGVINDDYNCLFANMRNSDFALGSHTILVNAEFVDTVAHNYGLRSISPCVDAGDPDPYFNDPDGTRNDIGAFPHTNTPPTVPYPYSPTVLSGPTNTTPTLSIQNSTDPENDTLKYDFEIFKDSMLTQLVASAANVPETHSPDSTSWTVTPPLDDNKFYYWRARAFDGFEYSAWSWFRLFIVNTANEPPTMPMLLDPPDSTGLPLLNRKPKFSWTYSTDPDPIDWVRYRFELATDSLFTFKYQNDSLWSNWAFPPDSLPFGSHYWWRVTAYDKWGLATPGDMTKNFWIYTLGDFDYSHNCDIADLSRLIDFLFISFTPISPSKIADLDGDCRVDISDLSTMIDALFISLKPLDKSGCGP